MTHQKYFIDIKKFVIDHEIKSGGYGSVYAVQNLETKEILAAKVIHSNNYPNKSTYKLMIHREIEVMKRCQHPALIRFRGFSLTDFFGKENVTIFMDLAQNGSLDHFLQEVRNDRCNLEFTNTHRQIILIGIANGMMNIYNHHYVHRDLKTLNILLDENLHPKITDFGLAKHYEKGDSTNQSRFFGTTIYMAPEVIKGEKFNEKSDVYSFGIIMYEVVTGCIPYSHIMKLKMDPLYFMNKLLNENIRPIFTTEVKKSIKNLIERCWSENPNERPTFEELYNKLAYNDEYFIDDDASNSEDGEFKYYLDGIDVDAVLNYTDVIEKAEQNFNEEITTIRDQLKILQTENKDLIKKVELLQGKPNTNIEKDDNNNNTNIIFSLVNVQYFNSLSLKIQTSLISEMMMNGINSKPLETISTLLNGIEPMNMFKSIRIQTDNLEQPLLNLESIQDIVLTIFDSNDDVTMDSFCSQLITLLKMFSKVLIEIYYPSKQFDNDLKMFSIIKKILSNEIFIKIFITGIEKVDDKFNENKDIDFLEIDSTVTSIVSNKNGSFSNCTSLKNVVLPNTLFVIEKGTFSGCCSLEEITIPVIVSSVKEKAFMNCSSLKKVFILSSLTTIENNTFLACSSLQQIVIPQSVKKIGLGAFKDCSSLVTVFLPHSITSIGQKAFDGCNKLSDVDLPANLEQINDFSFQNCTAFTRIYIPPLVKSIGKGAFKGCSSVKQIRIPKSLEENIGDNAFPRGVPIEKYTHCCIC